MTTTQANLDAATSFARGFLLASHWAEFAPDTDAATRVPRLAGQNLEQEFEAIGLLPADRRAALGTVWLSSTKRMRVDEVLGVHWSWLTDGLLQETSPALVLLALGCLRGNAPKELLRAIWPKMRGAKSTDLDVPKPGPAFAAALRRTVHARFTLLGDRPREDQPSAGLLLLKPRELYLLVQDLGLREISRAGGSKHREGVVRLLKDYQSAEVARIARQLKGQTQAGAEDADGEEVRAGGIAVDLVKQAVDATGGEGDVVGLVGLGKLALALREEPPPFVHVLAQRMQKKLGERLIDWHESAAGVRGSGDGPEDDTEGEVDNALPEVLDRMRAVLTQSSSGSLAKGDA